MEFDTDEALALAREYLQLHYLDRARLQCEAVLQREPENLDALYVLGWVYFYQGWSHAAVPMFQRVVAAYPQWTAALRGLAHATLDSGRRGEAQVWAERALALEPDDPDNLLVLAEVWVSRRPRYALQLVDRAAEIDPENSDGLRVRAAAYRRLMRFDSARKTLRTQVARDPEDWAARYNLAVAEGRGFRFARSVRGVFAAAAMFPQSGAQARSFLAFVLTRMVLALQVVMAVLAFFVVLATDETYAEQPLRPGQVYVDENGETSMVPLPIPEYTVPSFPSLPSFPTTLVPPTFVPGGTGGVDGRAEPAKLSEPAHPVVDARGVQRRVVGRHLPWWVRAVTGVALALLAAAVWRVARAVPRSGWAVVRETMRGFWSMVRVGVCVFAFVMLALSAVTGVPTLASFALLPLLFGIVFAVYYLLREL